MTDCTAPRHQDADEIPEAEQHAQLCRPCRHGLRRDLLRLPSLHADLRIHLEAQGYGSMYGKLSRDLSGVDRHGSDSLPYNDAVSECAGQIRHDLTWWARRITAERGRAAPDIHAHALDWINNPVKVIAAWLADQTRWISFRPWAGDITGAITDNTGRAQALLQPRTVKQITWMATCEHCETMQELQAIVYATEGDRRTSYIQCLTCHARWEFGPEWLRMAAAAERLQRNHQQVA